MLEEAIEECRHIDPWKNFSSIVASEFAGVAKISADIDTNLPYEVYSLGGVKLGNATDNLTPGLYIMRQGKATRKIVVK